MKKIILILILFLITAMYTELVANAASQNITATLSAPGPNPIDPGGGGGGGTGTAVGVGVGVGGGAAAAGATALAFAPLLLAGLTPNSVIYAAAPIGCVGCAKNFLQLAILNHFCTKDYKCALAKMKSDGKYYYAVNDSTIINGTFDIHSITLPKDVLDAQKIKINVTLVSQAYKEIDGEPELTFGLYKDINQIDLVKKFETQQFLHHYLMKKYEIPLKITSKNYNAGIQKLSTTINTFQIQNKKIPLRAVIRYTENGFKKNQKAMNPKALIYAYLIEFDKIR